ncbi:MAG: hypothetical protein K0S04_1602 [Herbinix sp.]|nr:hypothetical protein [Herbinix sp.]
MTRLEFMKELESLLLDIPLDERNEALAYYNGYFDDAGEEQEEEIVKELGSPQKVAALIKADLDTNSTDRENKGFFTEKGYQETIGSEYEITKSETSQSNHNSTSRTNSTNQTNQNNTNQTNQNNTGQTNYNYNGGANQGYTNYSNYQNGNSYNRKNYNGYGGSSNNGNNHYSDQQKGKTGSSNVLFIVLAIVTFPIWLPIVLTVLGIAIGVIATVVGLIFGFGLTGIALIGSGVILFVAGLAELATPFYGLLMIGGGLVITGLGMLITIAVGFVCKKVLPVLISGFVNLCRLPFRNRRAMA